MEIAVRRRTEECGGFLQPRSDRRTDRRGGTEAAPQRRAQVSYDAFATLTSFRRVGAKGVAERMGGQAYITPPWPCLLQPPLQLLAVRPLPLVPHLLSSCLLLSSAFLLSSTLRTSRALPTASYRSFLSLLQRGVQAIPGYCVIVPIKPYHHPARPTHVSTRYSSRYAPWRQAT